jgi:hypothetical protein
MTRKSTILQALALMAIGSLMGYAAASADRFRSAVAAQPPGDLSPTAAVTQETSCGAGNNGRGTLLALAEHTRTAAANAAQDGKKPNILVIFGEDIDLTNVSAYSMVRSTPVTPHERRQ